jgi:hypothetical protein
MTHAAPPTYTASKAWAGATISIVLGFLASLITALADDKVTAVEWLIATVAALTIAGSVFGGVYATTNRVKPSS